MTDAIINFSFAGLPGGDAYCYTGPNRYALDIAAGLQGRLPGTYSTIIRSESEPLATDRDKVWVQVNADGATTGMVFTYAYGKWVMQNPRRNPSERVWFEGPEDGSSAGVWSYDGGDGSNPSATPPTATTGAMWEVDTNYAFRFPLGAGTSPASTSVSVGDTGGEEDHTLLSAEQGTNTFTVIPDDGDDRTGERTSVEAITINGQTIGAHSGAPGPIIVPPNADAVGHNNMPPYRVGFWLKPTARIFFTA